MVHQIETSTFLAPCTKEHVPFAYNLNFFHQSFKSLHEIPPELV